MRGHRDLRSARQEAAGDRRPSTCCSRFGRALVDDLAAVAAGAGAEVDHLVGGLDGRLVVLDDQHGVAQIAQAARACG